MSDKETDEALRKETAEALALMRYDYVADERVGLCGGGDKACWIDVVSPLKVADEGYIADDGTFAEDLAAIQQDWQEAKQGLIERARKATGVEGLDLHVVPVPEDEGSYRLELVLAREDHPSAGKA